jgi:GNAT superfamily N-acetyltransferase
MVLPTHVLRTTGSDPVARELLGQITAEWTPVYGPPVPGDPQSVLPEDLPRYVALVEDGRPVAGGGLRPLAGAAGVAEVKRMYVVPDRRGEGLARQVLSELEACARADGWRMLRLDAAGTLAGFYASAGFEPVADYNGNPYATSWWEKAL